MTTLDQDRFTSSGSSVASAFIAEVAPIAASRDASAPPRRADGRRHKIVLYNPHAVFFTMPLALLAIGSELDPEIFEVVIIDARIDADAETTVRTHLDNALCVGVTVLTGAPILDAIQLSRSVKRVRRDMPVIWGGWHPSMFGKECFEEQSVDVTVQGQGEATFAELVDRLARGRSLEGCQGCTIRDTRGHVVENPRRSLQAVDSFKSHDYSLIPVERYFELKGKRQLDYISSQGCNFRCAFCADPFVYGRKWVGLSPSRMGDELYGLWDRYRFQDINFQDETFFTKRDRVEAIADAIISRRMPVTWAATMRADQGQRLPEPVLAKCRESGLRRVLIGVESGSDEMLARIKKDITIEQVIHSARMIRRHGIAGHFPFIVGFPGESDDSVMASLAMAKRLRAMSSEFQTPFFYFKPYPGTEITAEAVREGYRMPDNLADWSRFDFVGSVGGPWVSPEKLDLVERFKFYQSIAWDRSRFWERPIRKIAQWRCERDEYRWPIEMRVGKWLFPEPQLS